MPSLSLPQFAVPSFLRSVVFASTQTPPPMPSPLPQPHPNPDAVEHGLPLQDPVLWAEDGHTYERHTLKAKILAHGGESKLRSVILSNRTLKNAMEEGVLTGWPPQPPSPTHGLDRWKAYTQDPITWETMRQPVELVCANGTNDGLFDLRSVHLVLQQPYTQAPLTRSTLGTRVLVVPNRAVQHMCHHVLNATGQPPLTQEELNYQSQSLPVAASEISLDGVVDEDCLGVGIAGGIIFGFLMGSFSLAMLALSDQAHHRSPSLPLTTLVFLGPVMISPILVALVFYTFAFCQTWRRERPPTPSFS